MKQGFIYLLISMLLIAAMFFVLQREINEFIMVQEEMLNVSVKFTPRPTPTPIPEIRTILLDVPFTSQAPIGNWSDPRFNYGCEESSILMAIHWVNGTELTVQEAMREIAAISDFERRTTGEFHDRSAFDTTQLIKDYFGYQNVEFVSDIDTDDIKMELAKGNLVIIPVQGQRLGNPYFTPPGPVEHMVVVKGYDTDTKEFITNDPGTKRGEGMRYHEDVLETALRDYKTGYKEPIRKEEKNMIIISKDSLY